MDVSKQEVRERMQRISERDLVLIIEQGTEGYTPQALEVAREELEERHLLPGSKKNIVLEYWKERIRRDFRDIVFNNRELKSHFLSKEEILELMKEEFEYQKERRELMKIDTTLYWGAALM